MHTQAQNETQNLTFAEKNQIKKHTKHKISILT